MREIIIRADKKGRGHARPWNYGRMKNGHRYSGQGAMVDIGGKKYTVTSDGRVNIPKKVMNEWGIKGDDGRMRVAIDFSTKPSTAKRGKASNHWKNVASTISTPGKESKNAKTGAIAIYDFDDIGFPITDELLPESDEDYTWS